MTPPTPAPACAVLLAAACGLALAARAAAPPPPVPTAQELAARLGAIRRDGASFVRLRAEIKDPAGATRAVLQLQVKARRSATGTELVYQLLWPRERKGEAVLLRKRGDRAPGGVLFVPPGTRRPLAAADLKQGLFGTDLTLADAVEDFYAWRQQSLAGSEPVDGVDCQILESRPGQGQWASCARVRSWIDLRRCVPLRVEKYLASGRLAARIDTRKVVKDDQGRHIPAALLVRRAGSGSSTGIEGSRSVSGVAYHDRDFTPEGLADLTAPRAGR